MKRIAIAAAVLAAGACASDPYAEAESMSTFCARSYAGDMEGSWELAKINNESWTRSKVTLVASDTQFGGDMACNSYGVGGEADLASYYAVDNKRLVLPDRILQSTEKCRKKRDRRFDEAYVRILESRPFVVRDEDQLCLRTDDGRSLEFWRAR